MHSRASLPSWFDRASPVSPTEEQWAQLDLRQREAVLAALPCVVENDFMSEGDAHARAVLEASQQLEGYFGGGGPSQRPFYIGRSVMVHYPGEPGFAPDLFLVFDVPDGDRTSYVVLAEGRPLTFAFEVLSEGDRSKDLVRNVAKFARLGIPEYFVLDLKRRRLHGFRLNGPGGIYDSILPQFGRFECQTLGLWLGLEGTRPRFFVGDAALPTDREVRARLELNLQQAMESHAAEAHAAETETRRAETEARRAESEAERAREAEHVAETEARRAAAAEARVVELERRIRELERS